MRVLFSPIGTIYDNGSDLFYGSDVYTQMQRYRILGEEMTVLLKHVNTDKPIGVKRDPLDTTDIVTVKKINTVKSWLIDRHYNDRVIEEAVKKSDLCICHVPCSTSYQTIKYAKKYGKPYMTVVVACPWDSLWNYDWRGKLMAPSAFMALRKAQKNTSHTIYVTKEFLQKRYPSNGVQLGASDVDMKPVKDSVINHRMQRINSIAEGEKSYSITTVAALIPYKGQRYVIRAISELKKKGFSFVYNVVGLGDQEKLKELARQLGVLDQVIFHGKVSHEKVFEILDSTDIYIQPSKQEGLPRAMVEAMGRGCLAMGSNIAGIPELVPDKFLFPKGNVAAIVSILEKIDKQSLSESAIYSFEKAKEYDSVILQKKYHDFLVDFRSYAESKIENRDC